MKFLIVLIFPLSVQAHCWRKVFVKEKVHIFTVNLLSPSMETESEKRIIFLDCKHASKIKIKDEIELDEKTIKYNKLESAGVMMKKTYLILDKH